MKITARLITLLITLNFSLITAINAQKSTGSIPFYAEPYYNYNPLKITVGKYKEELLTNDTAKLSLLEDAIKNDINNTDVESIYFLSIRLYDLGKKDDAFYWFQTAKARARIVMNMMDPAKIGSIGDPAFELKQLFISINQLAGEYLNGYGLNDIDKGLAVFEKVKDEVKNIQSYKAVYKNIAFVDDSNLEKEEENKENDLTQTIDYIKSHKDEILKQRIAKGIQNKY